MCLIPYTQSSDNVQNEEKYSTDTITIVTGDWKPYIGSDLPNYGPVAVEVTKTFKKAGYKVEYIWVPWARAFKMIEHHDVDASATWRKTDERAKTVLFADTPIMPDSYDFYLYYKKGKEVQWKEIKELAKYSFVGIYAHDYSKIENTGINISRVNSEKQALLSVYHSGYDIFVSNPKPVEIVLENDLADIKDEIERSNKPVNQTEGFLIFPKNEKGELLKKIYEKYRNMEE